MSTAEEKIELLELMVKVHGIHYAFGWLRAVYVHGPSLDEDVIIETTKNSLLAELAAKETQDA